MSVAEFDANQANQPEKSEKPEKIHLPKTSESEQLKKIRHTTSHVMAMAVQKLFPKAQVTIGPWIENGFYYDFDSPEPFTEKDLKAIKKRDDKNHQTKIACIAGRSEPRGSCPPDSSHS